jgi:hypothetical protein
MIEDQTTQKLPVVQHRKQRAYGSIPGRNASRVALPRWIMIVIAVLVIASGVGVFTLTQRSTSPNHPQQARGVATHTTSNGNLTQGVKSGNSPATTSTRPDPSHTPSGTTMFTCSGSSSHSDSGSFTFTGVVAGTILLSTFQACYSATISCYSACSYKFGSGGHTYFGRAEGKINGVTYQFEFLINPYSGPGTYTSTASTNVVLMQNNHEWESYGAKSNRTSILVSANGKTGSIRATISMMSPEYDPTSAVTVIGNWSN